MRNGGDQRTDAVKDSEILKEAATNRMVAAIAEEVVDLLIRVKPHLRLAVLQLAADKAGCPFVIEDGAVKFLKPAAKGLT